MLKIYRLNDNEYIVAAGSKAIYGDLRKTALVLHSLHVEWNDIENGLVSLQANNHQVAEYGVNHTLIYTKAID